MVITEFLNNIWYLLSLTTKPLIFWEVLPLAIITILIIAYFQLYKNEKPGWNTYLSNSLVLIFISVSLIKFVYTMDADGIANFTDFPSKTVAIIILIGLGIFLTKFNFEHLLPEKYAIPISSPITINLIAYAVILFVHSESSLKWINLVSLIIIVVGLSILFNLIKIPFRYFFIYFEKEKHKERIENIKEAKLQIDELKKEVKYREDEIIKQQFRNAEKEKKEAIKIEKTLQDKNLKKHKKRK